MNKTETLAFNWLKQQGYKESEITFVANKSPDFICNDRNRYEVKFLYGSLILFSKKQIETLQPNDIILVFDDKLLKDKFSWKNKEKSLFKIHCPQRGDPTTITIEVETRKLLNRLKYEWGCKSIDETVSRLVTASQVIIPASELPDTFKKGGIKVE